MKDEIEQVYTEQRNSILSRLGTKIPREDAEDILHTVLIRSLQNLDSLADKTTETESRYCGFC